ncbi:MAG TPA: FUSC family protein [Candidatus Acidoferrales bacterium]|nr:FUSC family protein [Candidatus Acidoferrales bacterium]
MTTQRHFRVAFWRAVQRLDRLAGLRHGGRILIGSAIAWLVLQSVGRTDPLWAMISVVVVTDSEVTGALTAFRSRISNTIIGCVVGMVFLLVFGNSVFSILGAMLTAVVISSDVVKVPVSWRIAPITACIVMIPAVLKHSEKAAEYAALLRSAEVLLGSAIAVAVTFATNWFFRVAELRRNPADPHDVAKARAPRQQPVNIDE